MSKIPLPNSPPPTSLPQIGIFLGSTRPGGNGVGINSWISAMILQIFPSESYTILPLNPLASSLGPIEDPDCPFTLESTLLYPSIATRNWSTAISSCSAVIILLPQHNYGYPASIKLAIDHLGREWKDKLVLLIGYSARGDGRGILQLIEVLEGALNARVLGGELVEIKLPMDFVSGSGRVGNGGREVGKENEGVLSFLKEREEGIRKVLGELKELVESQRNVL